MYAVLVPLSKWHEVQQYLEHNYNTCPTDYTYRHMDRGIELLVKHSDLHDRIIARWAL
jgi:hypothetical protein